MRLNFVVPECFIQLRFREEIIEFDVGEFFIDTLGSDDLSFWIGLLPLWD